MSSAARVRHRRHVERRPDPLPRPIIIKPGQIALVLSASFLDYCSRSVCVSASQEESTDDGGSQSPVGFIEFGAGAKTTQAEFDVRDGVVLCVPARRLSVSVLNRNEPGDPDVSVIAFLVDGESRGTNTRSYDIDPYNPNIRVPPFADRVVYELAKPDPSYRALVSDSATGETYGQIPPGVVYQLHHRARWIRFFDVSSEAGGIVTFVLSI